MDDEQFREFPNFKENFNKYLLQNSLDNGHKKNMENMSRSCKGRPDEKIETVLLIDIDKLVPFFIDECLHNFLQISFGFASYYLHLLIRDSQDGLELNMPSHGVDVSRIEQFLLTALTKYRKTTDATVSCMKISHYCKNSQELRLNFVKEKCELDFNNKLKQIIESILQYPETSSDKQIEDMFLKMQLFVITNYQIGYPENNLLLSQCRQSLNSILGKGDIQKYVLRKRYHRLEYLQELGATAAGILIFNGQGPEGDKENIRNLFTDLKMAKSNTMESLEEGFDRVHHLNQKASKIMLELIEINIQQKKIYCLRPLAQIRELNKFVTLFEIYRKNLEKAKIEFEKTQYLIEVDQKKFDCVVEKINEILKYRSAIETEKIFPHFGYLSDIWKSLMLYINHIVKINKMKDHLDDLLSEELESKFNETLENLSDESKYLKHPLTHSFNEIIKLTSKRETELNMLNIKPFVRDYCALTMALTGGFLVPSQLEKKLCENVNFTFGFSKMEYAKYAENHFEDFIKIFRATILTCTGLIVLFDLDEEVIQQDFNLIQQTQAETNSLGTQTEMISYDNFPRNRVGENWNVWDFHRQTIKLANIKKGQTNSTQSNLSFGIRNAQNQCEWKLNIATQK